MDHDAALQQAGDQLGMELKVLDNLPGSDRASVVRVRNPDEKTYVLKSFDPASAGEGWVREAAALATLRGRGMPIPTLVASGDEPPWVLMSDLGTGPNLATALLTADPIEAQRALLDWAFAVGTVHSGSGSARELFSNNLDQRCGDLPVAIDTTEIFLADTAEALTSILPSLGISSFASALAELRAVNRHLGFEHALSPADTCPDNNIRTPDGMQLLDFEGANFRHIAWDAAYLTVPWPSCWCSWALPAAVTESAVSTWRAAVSVTFPSAATPDFDAKLEIARTAWAFVSASWFLPRALGDDPPPDAERLAGLVPSRRAMIQHRLRGVLLASTDALPNLRVLAESLLTELNNRWGVVPLALAPAFR